jgi:hypothetical protein
MALILDYKTTKSYYDFYKTTDWKSKQLGRALRSDVITIDFNDNIVIDGELQPFQIYIMEHKTNPKMFDSTVTVKHLRYTNVNKSLRDIVKWVNSIFAQKYCVLCKCLTKVDKERGYCVDCYKLECFKVKTNKSCAICMEEITYNVHRTACNHFFHFKCIIGLDKCPLCRYKLLGDDIEWHDYDAESSEDDTY